MSHPVTTVARVTGTRPEKYTPSVLRTALQACPRWLNAQLRPSYHVDEPFHRWNVRNVLLSRLVDAHAGGGAPSSADVRRPPRSALLPEERSFFEHFVQVYADVFAEEPGVARMHGCERPSDIRGVTLGGAVDLLIDTPNGRTQLRQLELWGRDVTADPLASWELSLSLLRLHRIGGLRGGLEICHVDLNRGTIARCEVDVDAAAAAVVGRLGATIPDVRSRASTPVAVPGANCAQCSDIPPCPAWDSYPPARSLDHADGPRYVGRVAQLNPTSVETWLDCPRKWRARHVLGLPGWPVGERGRLGIQVHESLARLHEAGPCADHPARRRAAATVAGEVDARLLEHLERHSSRCPSNAVGSEHEISLAELLSDGPQAVMLTARIDAIWEHDGLLDCRDYKTGAPRFDRVADHVGAQIQALVLAPVAAARGLRLRLRYEQLAEGDNDDPEVWEPDDDDLEAARHRFHLIAEEMASSDFAGVADPVECRSCPYWRHCPDSAADEVEDDDVMITIIEPEERDVW